MGCAAAGLHVRPGHRLAVARIALALPPEVWEQPERWKPSPAAVLLLSSLATHVPPGVARPVGGLEQQQEQQQHQQHPPEPEEEDGVDWAQLREELEQAEALRGNAGAFRWPAGPVPGAGKGSRLLCG